MPASTIERVREAVPLVDVAGEPVALVKAGRTLKGLCPFHTEQTPSFYVYPASGRFRCFGCSASGDIFTFVMLAENVDFGQALRRLADRAGVPLALPRADDPRALSGLRIGAAKWRLAGGSCRPMREYLLLLIGLFRATVRDRGDLVAENLLLRHQLAVLTRPTRRRPPPRARDKLFWIVARMLRRDWRRHLVLVRPETVIRWHRSGWTLFWRWKSRGRPGRPRLNLEVRELIARIARDNPSWGAERIRGELLKLGIAVSRASVQLYRRRGPARPPRQSWRTFLHNHRSGIWAADLLTVRTLTFRTLYVLVFISHARRELVHLNVTANPTAAWVWRQLIAATPWGRVPRYLIRDRDAVYGGDFVPKARGLGIDTLLTPVRAPRANAIAERVVGTLRRECLDQAIVVNEAHLRALLDGFLAYDNRDRPHRALRLETPQPVARATVGPIRRRAVLGGLHQVYERAA